MIIVLKDKHTLKIDDFNFRCSIGKMVSLPKRRRRFKSGKYNLGNYIIER